MLMPEVDRVSHPHLFESGERVGESVLISPVPRIFCAFVNGIVGGGAGGCTGFARRPGIGNVNFDV
jgi:hypothetical protein